MLLLDKPTKRELGGQQEPAAKQSVGAGTNGHLVVPQLLVTCLFGGCVMAGALVPQVHQQGVNGRVTPGQPPREERGAVTCEAPGRGSCAAS